MKLGNFYLALTIAFSVMSCAHQRQVDQPKPAIVTAPKSAPPQSTEKTDATEIESRVDAIFADVNKSDSPGCSLGVYRDGRIIYEKGYGMANLELGIPITPKSVFDIASISKQFTAMSILLLAKDGKLSLDDNIRKYLPDFPEYGQAITIRHLLHHTSGIRDYCELLSLAEYQSEEVATDKDAMKIIARQKALNFSPGDEHLYSNSGYFLLSLIVKRASGKSLRDFAEERIFRPLRMRNTQYNDSHIRIIPNRATAYDLEETGGLVINMSNWEQTGDGAVLTTIEDLFLWDQNFYDLKVGGADTVALMQLPGKLNNGTALKYAAGLGLGEYRGLRIVSHSGSWAGYRAHLVRFPDQKFSVACLCNLRSVFPRTLAMKVADVYLSDVMQSEAPAKNSPEAASPTSSVEVPIVELEKRVGAYRDADGLIWQLSVEQGKLIIKTSYGATFDTVLTGPDTLRTQNGPFEVSVTFERIDSGARFRLRCRIEGESEDFFYEPIDLWVPESEQLEEITGSYRSEELDTVITLVIKSGKLLLVHRLIEGDPLIPTIKDTLSWEGTDFILSRDSKKRINGFTYNSRGMRNIWFEKLKKQ